MPNNIELNDMSGGRTVATDLVSSVDYQLVQLVTGASGGSKTPVTDTNPYPVRGTMTNVAGAELTRPADTTAYTAKDAVGSSYFIFTNIARTSGASGYVVKARLSTDQAACTARFRLYVFTSAPTAPTENAGYDLLYSEVSSRVGWIDFGACATGGGSSTCAETFNADIRLPFLSSGSANLFGILVAVDGFTPASEQKFYVELTADTN